MLASAYAIGNRFTTDWTRMQFKEPSREVISVIDLGSTTLRAWGGKCEETSEGVFKVTLPDLYLATGYEVRTHASIPDDSEDVFPWAILDIEPLEDRVRFDGWQSEIVCRKLPGTLEFGGLSNVTTTITVNKEGDFEAEPLRFVCLEMDTAKHLASGRCSMDIFSKVVRQNSLKSIEKLDFLEYTTPGSRVVVIGVIGIGPHKRPVWFGPEHILRTMRSLMNLAAMRAA